jgi:hypothetical protein
VTAAVDVASIIALQREREYASAGGQECAPTCQENIEACVVQQESEAVVGGIITGLGLHITHDNAPVVGVVDDPRLASIEKAVLQKHDRRPRTRYAVHSQDVAVGRDDVV